MQSVPFFNYPNVFTRFEKELTEIMLNVCRRGAFIMQQELDEFEKNLAHFTGSKFALGVANATDGLIIALRAANIGHGDEVIFCSHTMVATAASIAMTGATPVPVEVGFGRTIDVNSIEKAITPKTKAIMPTQLNGRVSDMDSIIKIAENHNLTIVEDADKTGVSSTSLGDSRITDSGHFIRKWKLDELAQLINVLKGDMSLVGPRPEVREFVEMYTESEKRILTLRPGITDWASIWNSDEGGVLAGAKDPDSVYLEVVRPIKIQLQLLYVESRTFFVDLKILVYTVYRVLKSSFIPSEIATYPDFNELRRSALNVMNDHV